MQVNNKGGIRREINTMKIKIENDIIKLNISIVALWFTIIIIAILNKLVNNC